MPKPQQLKSDRVPTPMAHYSQGARVGDLIFLAGQIASDYRTGVPSELGRQPGYEYYGSNIKDQTRYILQNLQASLEDAGSDLEHVVKAQVFLKDSEDFNQFDEVWREFFTSPPPRTTVETGPKGLLVPGTLVEIDLIAVAADAADQPVALSSDRVPKPLANYTQATGVGDYLFLAGQVPSHFGEGGIAPEARVDPAFPYYASAIERQTRYTLDNLKALLEDIGSDLEHVVKAQIFLTNLEDFWEFDSVWKEYFETPPPRTTLQIGRLLLEQALVEIDLIAIKKDGSIKREVIRTDDAPHPKANYSQAVVAGDLVFLAGQLASDFKTGVASEAKVDPNFRFYGSEIEAQTEFIANNIEAVLKASGSSLENVVKAQTFLTDLDDFYAYDKVWKRHFETPPPRTTIELAGDGLLVPGTLVEIDVIAARE
jgi:reactive intermediate/imine deaminase